MVKAINSIVLVALLVFLASFYIASVQNISGSYAYRGERTCAAGDLDRDGSIATDQDVDLMDTIIDFVHYDSCADLDKDRDVDSDDMALLNSIKSRYDAQRQSRGRYCFDECPAEGEKICTAEGAIVTSGGTIARGEGVTYKICGNYDADPCREWSTETFACPQGTRCRIKMGSDICLLANIPESNPTYSAY